MTATPNPAQDVSDWKLRLRNELRMSAMKTTFTFTRDEVIDLMGETAISIMSARELQQAQSDALLEDTLEWIHNSPDLTKENFSKATAGLQQAQAVGGKIANGHHCGLPEYLCKHPSHAPQSSAPVVGDARASEAGDFVDGDMHDDLSLPELLYEAERIAKNQHKDGRYAAARILRILCHRLASAIAAAPATGGGG